MPLAVAEVASSADFAGVASPVDLAGSFPTDLAGAFPRDLAGMAFPAVAGVASPAVLAGMDLLAVQNVIKQFWRKLPENNKISKFDLFQTLRTFGVIQPNPSFGS